MTPPALLVLILSAHSAVDRQPAADAGLSLTDSPRSSTPKTAKADGSFRPGIDAEYEGISDSAYSDLAPTAYAVVIHKTFGWKLPHEKKTKEFLLSRQLEDGAFYNIAGTVDPKSAAGRAYNTTMALMALHALGATPKYDPLPVFDVVLKEDYKTLPPYMTSFFPLAYLCSGRPIPKEADEKLRALMVQDADGYLNEHIAATFHAAHYYRLTNRETPKANAMLKRVLRDQKPDWKLAAQPAGPRSARDIRCGVRVEATRRQSGRLSRCDRQAAKWALSCRNLDGGFGHFPGSPSDADANYFQLGTLVMAGWLKPVQPLPRGREAAGVGALVSDEMKPVEQRDNVKTTEIVFRWCGSCRAAVRMGLRPTADNDLGGTYRS